MEKNHSKDFNGMGEIFDKSGIRGKAIIYSLILGILCDYFFIWDSFGISIVIFNGIFMIAAVNLLYSNVNLKRNLSYIFLISYILLSFSYCIFSNEVFRFFNFILLPLLAIGYMISIRYEEMDINLNFIGNIFIKIFETIGVAIPIFYRFSKEGVKKREIKKNTNLKYVMRGILISIPILIVIIFLLSSADMVFSQYFSHIGDVFDNVTFKNFIGHIFVIVIVTVYVFALFFKFKYDEKPTFIRGTENFNENLKWNSITVLTIMIGINVVYLAFSIIQFSYLYAGGRGNLPAGISYAQYARKGFSELVIVTLINLTIVLCSKFYAASENKKMDRACNIFYSILIGFTYNMLFSAHYRMNLYESAFGYTRLRVFVEVFIFLLSLIFVVVFLRIWRKDIPVLKSVTIITLVIYIALNFINVDKIIVKKNIDRYRSEGKLDVNYITSLSYDAYDEMVKLLDIEDVSIKPKVKEYFERRKESLSKTYDHWYEFNYYKNKFK